MKRIVLLTTLSAFGVAAMAQNVNQGKMIEVPKGGFYDQEILKDVREVDESLNKKKEATRFIVDQSSLKLPNKVSLYTRVWSNPVISQGNAGTCWDYSTSAFYESEIYRLQKKQVKLSEIYNAYWEYVEKARRFVQERGNSAFEEGSQGNALARLAKTYGMMPYSAYTGLTNGRKYHSHAAMMEEMTTYLQSVKRDNNWNETQVLATIREILNHHLGTPPAKFTVDGKEYTPQSYMKDYLRFNPNDYVDILSYKQKEFWKKAEYEVTDNWWHSEEYYNVPLEDYMKALKQAIRNGYSMSIGGDVSEAGLSRTTQCALIPDFDIPSAYINDDARQFRFSNKTTTDDHGMQLVGYVENFNGDGKDWYLIKDSSAGSRNNDKTAPEFGYYFFSEDYVKLKMMSFTIHKDAVKDLLTKFR